MAPTRSAVAVVPARLASKRFPGKPLAAVQGRSLLARLLDSLDQAPSLSQIVVASSDDAILDHVAETGPEQAVRVKTPANLATGTDRVAWAAEHLGLAEEVVINVQADNLWVAGETIDQLVGLVTKSNAAANQTLATLVRPLKEGEDWTDPNRVKAVMARSGHALYFSRAPIPSHLVSGRRSGGRWIHVGLYAFHRDSLATWRSLAPSDLEKTEGLEQLRWLEAGFPIQLAVADAPIAAAIDAPRDLQLLRADELQIPS